MKERGILFSAPMVRALMDGSKTQTRRVIKDQSIGEHFSHMTDDGRAHLEWLGEPSCGSGVWDVPEYSANVASPYGVPGDRLWVREAWRAPTGIFDGYPPRDLRPGTPLRYEADGANSHTTFSPGKLRPSMFMPRWASRILRELVSVRVEQLQDISEVDAVAEGIRISSKVRRSDACYGIYECSMPDGKTHFNDSACALYRVLWEQLNGPGSWDVNPWVWAYGLKEVKP